MTTACCSTKHRLGSVIWACFYSVPGIHNNIWPVYSVARHQSVNAWTRLTICPHPPINISPRQIGFRRDVRRALQGSKLSSRTKCLPSQPTYSRCIQARNWYARFFTCSSVFWLADSSLFNQVTSISESENFALTVIYLFIIRSMHCSLHGFIFALHTYLSGPWKFVS